MFRPPLTEIFEILDTNRHRFIGTKNSATHKRLLNEILAPFGVFCSVESLVNLYKEYREFGTLRYNNVRENSIVLTGFFYGLYRRKKNIELVLCYPYDKKTFPITDLYWEQFRFEVAQFVCHEMIHRHQTDSSLVDCKDRRLGSYRNGRQRLMPISKMEREWIAYYSDSDELDATAHCIALDLVYRAKDPLITYKLLRKPTAIVWNESLSPLFAGVMVYLGGDLSSPLAKRFLKRIYRYVDAIFEERGGSLLSFVQLNTDM